MNPTKGDKFKVVIRVDVIPSDGTEPAVIQDERAPAFRMMIPAQRESEYITFGMAEIMQDSTAPVSALGMLGHCLFMASESVKHVLSHPCSAELRVMDAYGNDLTKPKQTH